MTNVVTVIQTGEVNEIDFEEGMTVGEALEKAAMSVGEGMEIRLNGDAHDDLEEVLSAGDTILIVGAIRGA